MPAFDDDFMKAIRSSPRFQQRRQRLRRSLESRMVRWLVEYYDLGDRIDDWVREVEAETGTAWLPFAKFMRYCQFPVWLSALRSSHAARSRPEDLLAPRRHKRSFVFRALAWAVDRAPAEWLEAGQPVGACFLWFHTGAPRAMWLVHTALDHLTGRPAAVLSGPEGTVVVQPFAEFLQQLRL